MKKETLAFDTKRHKDVNGYLHVDVSPLTKETVNPYYGREIPGWEDEGLDPEKIYYGYRSGEELKKALNTFNGIPVLDEHKLDSAEKPLKEERVGYTGTSAAWEAPYIMNALIITDAAAIELIESNKQRELSASYRYKPVFKEGYFGGEKYDFIMTEIQANHIALVAEGRAGSDVLVYDKQLEGASNASPADFSFSSRFGREKVVLVGKHSPFPPCPYNKGTAPNLCESSTQLTNKQSNKGENEMAKNVEGLKQALDGLVQAFNNFLDEEAKEPEHASDSEYKEAMDAAGCDSESEAEQKAFVEGVKYAENSSAKKADDEDKPASDEEMKEAMTKAGCDSESEAEQKAFAEGVKYAENLEAKKADDEEMNKKTETASDKMISKAAMDAALKQAENRGAEKAKQHIKELYEAAEAVRKTVAVKPLAYDSAAAIYKVALQKENVSVQGVESSAYASLYNAVVKNKLRDSNTAAFDSKPDEDNAFSKIKQER